MVTCFCGIKLNHITSQSCPLPFKPSSNAMDQQPQNPNSGTTMSTMKPSSSMKNPSSSMWPDTSLVTLPSLPTGHNTSTTTTITTTKNATDSSHSDDANHNTTRITPSNPMGSSDLLHSLASNCTDHSYSGCSRCLATLRKVKP